MLQTEIIIELSLVIQLGNTEQKMLTNCCGSTVPTSETCCKTVFTWKLTTHTETTHDLCGNLRNVSTFLHRELDLFCHAIV